MVSMGLRSIGQETLRIIEQGAYVTPGGLRVDLAAAAQAAREATELLTPATLINMVRKAPAVNYPEQIIIEVTPESTQASCYRLLDEAQQGDKPSSILALNFASARNPGGGFLSGAQAQEEDLCRASALYPCLLATPEYYAANQTEARASGLALYSDHMILSPEVPFFRGPNQTLLPRIYLVSVLTAPAPNSGAVLYRQPHASLKIERTFRRRIAMVLALSAARGYRCLVLGAWGCGAFQGDPELVASIFAEELSGRFRHAFKQVTFAVLARSRPGKRNYEVFRSNLDGLA
jgi:uncharacterized protein (TIGR02452 family)